MRKTTCRSMRAVAALGVLIGAAATASAGQLLGLASDSGSSAGLYALNEATGAATRIATVNDSTSLVGLDFLNGTLYATDVFVSGHGFSFGSIDPLTGAFTFINNQGGSSNWQGLAGNESAGVLYTVDNSDATKLKTVTPTGTITTIGTTGIGAAGLAYDNLHGVLYGASGGQLYRIDTTTGASTLVGSMGVNTARLGLEYDPGNATLFANVSDGTATGGKLYRVNATTGSATLIGSNGVTDGAGIDSLALNPTLPVPEPSTLIPAGFASAVALGYGWRVRKARRAA